MSRLELQNITYTYNGRDIVLKDVNYQFKDGNMYAIVGKSGAGKTTLLSLLSQLTAPSDGNILYEGKSVGDMDPYEYRSKYIGVVFQSFNILPHSTAVENVVLSMDIANIKQADKKAYALALLEKVSLEDDKANRRILKLSRGQQRVAIARALSYNPHILLADEPTGNLDEDTLDEILAIF